MKTKLFFRMLAQITILFGINNYSYAQAIANAGASANVIVPVSVVKTNDMNFGNAAVSAVSGGGIILTPGGTRTTVGGGVTLPATTGSVAPAGFTVSGAPGYTFAITLPGSAIITGPGTATMTINGFTSIPSGIGTLSSTGSQVLAVGATLSVAAAQVPGIYTNATGVPVTVNYN